MRNEMEAKRLRRGKRLAKLSWSESLLVGNQVERALAHRKHNSKKDGREPLCLRVLLVAHPVGKSEALMEAKGL